MKYAPPRGMLLILIVVSGVAGCHGGGRWLAPPGPLNQQQASAVINDPYPQNDIGPSEAGARPPSYQNPLPEPVRNRIVKDSMPWASR